MCPFSFWCLGSPLPARPARSTRVHRVLEIWYLVSLSLSTVQLPVSATAWPCPCAVGPRSTSTAVSTCGVGECESGKTRAVRRIFFVHPVARVLQGEDTFRRKALDGASNPRRPDGDATNKSRREQTNWCPKRCGRAAGLLMVLSTTPRPAAPRRRAPIGRDFRAREWALSAERRPSRPA
jgi:hypothetical protein